MGAAIGLWVVAYKNTATRSFDFGLVGVLLFVVILYGVLNHVLPYQVWKHHPTAPGPPRQTGP